MHKTIGLDSVALQPTGTVDGITLHRDPHTDEWVFDLTPGIDLLEVMHVLAAVQQHALQLLQKQMQLPAMEPGPAGPPTGMPPSLPNLNNYAPL